MQQYKVEVKCKRKGIRRSRVVNAYSREDALMVFCQRYGHSGRGAFAWYEVTPLDIHNREARA